MPHYYSEKQDAAFELKTITIRLKKTAFDLYSASGIFSKDAVDFGTRLLIENSVVQDGWDVLDLGCGNGVVGISLKKQHPTLHIVMSDVNERAVELANKNIALHHLTEQGITAVQSDLFSNEKIRKVNFDTILLNPPHAAGKEVCFRMITESCEHLKPGGTLQLVARHNKGGASLEKKMQEVFGNVKTIAKRGGFRVYVGMKE
ncbi:MAG: methyltransferase [Nanoarchaeota archaeon]